MLSVKHCRHDVNDSLHIRQRCRSDLGSGVLDQVTRLLAESADGHHTEPMRGEHLAPAPAPTTRVTTFELFFDLGDRALDPALVVAALMSLGLAAALWSLYFLDLDDDAQRSLETAPSERVVRIAGRAFGYGFVPLLGGIVMISAGLAEVLDHPLARLSPSSAAFLAGGAGIYILGIAAFRQAVAAAGGTLWLASGAATAACILAMWLGAALVALAEVALLGIILFGLAMVSHRLRTRVRQDASGALPSD